MTKNTKLRIDILIPSLNRAEKLTRTLVNLLDTTRGHDVQMIVSLEKTDRASKLAVAKVVTDHEVKNIRAVTREPGTSAVEGWNHALANARHNADAFVLGADDFIWGEGWLDAIVKAMRATKTHGLYALNDGLGRDFPATYVMTRSWLISGHGGVMAIPHYRSWEIDVEAARRAQRDGVYHLVADAKISTPHPDLGNGTNDTTYEVARQHHQWEYVLRLQRQQAGWPDDFAPILEA